MTTPSLRSASPAELRFLRTDLKGPEVTSLRHGRAALSDAWVGERAGELYLFNAYIPEYQGGVLSRFEPRAPRKLLVKWKQLRHLLGDGRARG